MVEINYGSIKVVKKNGFKKEATLVSEELHGKKDIILLFMEK